MKGNYATKLHPKIVHISTLFYQTLSIISSSGRKLLKMQNNKSLFKTPSTYKNSDNIKKRICLFLSFWVLGILHWLANLRFSILSQ